LLVFDPILKDLFVIDESDVTLSKLGADAMMLVKKLNKSPMKPIVIGHDWGGMITWYQAYKYADIYDSASTFVMLLSACTPFFLLTGTFLRSSHQHASSLCVPVHFAYSVAEVVVYLLLPPSIVDRQLSF
jgi:pimeloyl-ACP methyl ester carboxylesterase